MNLISVVLFLLLFHNKITNSAKMGLALRFGGMIILVGPSIGGQGLSLIGVAPLGARVYLFGEILLASKFSIICGNGYDSR